MVALTHGNIINSSLNISNALNLKTDKNIILMPSFHIHGIIASILAPLYSGGSVVVYLNLMCLLFIVLESTSPPGLQLYQPRYNQSWIGQKIIKR